LGTNPETVKILRSFAVIKQQETIMKSYNLFDLIDIDRIQAVTDSFYEVAKIPASVVDLDGNILTTSGTMEICKKFHRSHPQTREKCIESDTTIANQLLKEKKFAVYECLNGLVDAAVPIVIEKKHMGNFLTGQFLFVPPNMDYFRKQAYKYGFDETGYLDALSRVPVISRKRVESILSFLSCLAEFIGDMALRRKDELNGGDLDKKQMLGILSALNKSVVGIFDREGSCEFAWADQSLDEVYGVRADHISISRIRKENLFKIQQVFDHGEILRDEYCIEAPGGEFWHDVTFSPRLEPSGRVSGVVALVRDITNQKAENLSEEDSDV
jgi:ligand-binding sensor protein